MRKPSRHRWRQAIFLGLLWGASLILGCAATARTGEDAPATVRAAALSVCRPVFILDRRSSPSGTGFILNASPISPRDFLVTAHHLFGMATATSTGMAWQDVQRRVSGATCQSLDETHRWSASAAIPIPGVKAFWRTQVAINDVALLPILAGPKSTLSLSLTPPVPGQVVYVLARAERLMLAGGVVHRARVVDASGFLAFIYDEPSFLTANTSGAPVVAADGTVVGVNVGAGRLPNGALLGVADDLTTLNAALSAAPPAASTGKAADRGVAST